MNIPAAPLGSGQSINGKVSWFGGPNDHSDSGHTASGVGTNVPGIAVYNRATLGGYWRVTDTKTGRSAVLKQTDLGPAPWTGRKIDVTYSALGKFGYGENNFPTDSQFTATYLGRNPGAATASPGIASLPGSTIPTAGAPQLDQKAFRQAEGRAMVGRLLASAEGDKTSDNPLFTSGLLSTAEPNTQEYMRAPTAPTAPSGGTPQLPLGKPGQGELGGFLPSGAQLKMGRIDQGQDIQTNAGGPIVAPGDGVVVAVHNNPGGFGENYPVVKFTSGPLAGQTVYLGHTHSALKSGDSFKEGQVLSHTGYGTPREGNARTPGWAEIGLWGPNGPGNMEAGKKIAPYLRRR